MISFGGEPLSVPKFSFRHHLALSTSSKRSHSKLWENFCEVCTVRPLRTTSSPSRPHSNVRRSGSAVHRVQWPVPSKGPSTVRGNPAINFFGALADPSFVIVTNLVIFRYHGVGLACIGSDLAKANGLCSVDGSSPIPPCLRRVGRVNRLTNKEREQLQRPKLFDAPSKIYIYIPARLALVALHHIFVVT